MLSMYLGKQCVFLSSNGSERNVISNINAWVNYSKKEDTVLEIGFPIGFHVVWIKERQICFRGLYMFILQGLGAQRIFYKAFKEAL